MVTTFVLNARKCDNLLSKKACQELGLIKMCETQCRVVGSSWDLRH